MLMIPVGTMNEKFPEPKYDRRNSPENRRYFENWFGSLLKAPGQSTLMKDILHNKKEDLWEEWKKVQPYVLT